MRQCCKGSREDGRKCDGRKGAGLECAGLPNLIKGVFGSVLLRELWKESRIYSRCLHGDGEG